MTQLPLMEIEPELQPLPEGSHQLSRNGDKVVVHRLPIFAVNNVSGSGKLGEVDDDRLQEILEATQARALKGAFPRVIEGHNSGKKDFEPPAVGRLVSLRIEPDSAGDSTIYADMEVSEFYFRDQIASNRYPRRSAEILKDSLELTEVALLGSNTPAIPLEDTQFSRDAEAVAYYQVGSEPTSFQHDGEQAMTDDDRKAIAELVSDAVDARFKAHFADSKSKDQEDEEEDEEMQEDEDEKDESKCKNASADEKANYAALKAEFEVQKTRADRLEATLQAAVKMQDEEYVTGKLQYMKSVGGFTSIDIEEETKRLLALGDRKKMDAEMQHIEAHYARDLTAAAIMTSESAPREYATVRGATGDKAITEDRIKKAGRYAKDNKCSVKMAYAHLFESETD